MAITASDIQFRTAITSGSAGDSATQPDPNLSLGKYVSQSQITAATLHALFDKVTGDENAASEAEYRCVFILNNHATLTWEAVKVWLSAEVSGGAAAAIAIDNIAASAKGSASAQAAQIANEDTAPTGVGSFSSPTTKAGGLSLGDLAPGQARAIWVRRTTANTSAVDSDGVTIRAEGDTGA